MFTLIVDLSLEMIEVENVFKNKRLWQFLKRWAWTCLHGVDVWCVDWCNVFQSEELSQQVCIMASTHV